MTKIRVVIDYQHQSINKLVPIGIDLLQMDRKEVDIKTQLCKQYM